MLNKGSAFRVLGSAFWVQGSKVQKFRVKRVRLTWANMLCILLLSATLNLIKARARKTMDCQHCS